MNTTENNKLFAEFEGRTKDEDSPWYRGFDLMVHGSITCHEERLKYHTSWDWLMPVIQKIRELHYMVTLSGVSTISHNTIMKSRIMKATECKYEDIPLIAEVVNGLAIHQVYDLCLQFITYYNQQAKAA